MDFGQSEELASLHDLIARFVEREVPPELAEKWDRDDLVPREMIKRLTKS